MENPLSSFYDHEKGITELSCECDAVKGRDSKMFDACY